MVMTFCGGGGESVGVCALIGAQSAAMHRNKIAAFADAARIDPAMDASFAGFEVPVAGQPEEEFPKRLKPGLIL
jgi:hypothetical protein